MVQSLYKLPCFTHITAIEPIIAGLSSHCYQIQADNKYFFAKKITTLNEPKVSLHAAKINISPKVIYHDQHWLITQFFNGNNLFICPRPLDEKIKIATKLMAQCHTIDAQPVLFEAKKITNELINKIKMSALNKRKLQNMAEQLNATLTLPSNTPTNLVCCHGDVNFSNILMSIKNKAYLVDFECACIAPAEYDLAMFVAVNNLSKDAIVSVIQNYNTYSLCNINQASLATNLQFCYFINMLWYVSSYNKTASSTFLNLAKQQGAKLELAPKLPPFTELI